MANDAVGASVATRIVDQVSRDAVTALDASPMLVARRLPRLLPGRIRLCGL
ncbi:MAG: hypothetical protein ABJA82_09740 [Myxococcales bacterium]